MEYNRICAHCGKKFIAKAKNKRYCSKECIREEQKDRYKRQRQGNRAAVEDNLQRCAREAREAGMSYGQYMAMKY